MYDIVYYISGTDTDMYGCGYIEAMVAPLTTHWLLLLLLLLFAGCHNLIPLGMPACTLQTDINILWIYVVQCIILIVFAIWSAAMALAVVTNTVPRPPMVVDNACFTFSNLHRRPQHTHTHSCRDAQIYTWYIQVHMFVCVCARANHRTGTGFDTLVSQMAWMLLLSDEQCSRVHNVLYWWFLDLP